MMSLAVLMRAWCWPGFSVAMASSRDTNWSTEERVSGSMLPGNCTPRKEFTTSCLNTRKQNKIKILRNYKIAELGPHATTAATM